MDTLKTCIYIKCGKFSKIKYVNHSYNGNFLYIYSSQYLYEYLEKAIYFVRCANEWILYQNHFKQIVPYLYSVKHFAGEIS